MAEDLAAAAGDLAAGARYVAEVAGEVAVLGRRKRDRAWRDALGRVHEGLMRARVAGGATVPREMQGLATALAAVPETALRTLPPRVRIAMELLRRGHLEPAWVLAHDNASGQVRPKRAVATWAGRSALRDPLPVPYVIEGDRVWAFLPGFRDPRWGVDDEVYQVEVTAEARLDGARLGAARSGGTEARGGSGAAGDSGVSGSGADEHGGAGGGNGTGRGAAGTGGDDGEGSADGGAGDAAGAGAVLHLYGTAALTLLDSGPQESVSVVWRGPGGAQVAVAGRRARRPDLPLARGAERDRLAWSGWTAAIPLDRLAETPGKWRATLELTQDTVIRSVPLGTERGPLAAESLVESGGLAGVSARIGGTRLTVGSEPEDAKHPGQLVIRVRALSLRERLLPR